MTGQPVSAAAEDDWDAHWNAFGDNAAGLPANKYRRRLILDALGDLSGATLVDIGAGQGEFAVSLAEEFPSATVFGVEYSATGVERAQERAAAAGVKAQFLQADLLQPVTDAKGHGGVASHALCTEVLEHVDEPSVLLRNASAFLAPGARLVVTVPAGPRTAYDKYIGHKRHFTRDLLRRTLTDAGFEVERVSAAGFPFFDLYRLASLIRGKKLITDFERGQIRGGAALTVFDKLFRFNRDDTPFGWQLVAVARLRP